MNFESTRIGENTVKNFSRGTKSNSRCIRWFNHWSKNRSMWEKNSSGYSYIPKICDHAHRNEISVNSVSRKITNINGK